jgi:hypothetical protein
VLYTGQSSRDTPNGLEGEDAEVPPVLEFLQQEGFDKQTVALLLQQNSKRVLGIFSRPGGLGRVHTEPDVVLPSCWFIEDEALLICLSIEIPVSISDRYFMTFIPPPANAIERNWAIEIPREARPN